MATTTRLRGVVRNGVIVPPEGVALAEGAEVEFQVMPAVFTPEEEAEYRAWQELGHQAWNMIDQWEAEDAAG